MPSFPTINSNYKYFLFSHSIIIKSFEVNTKNEIIANTENYVFNFMKIALSIITCTILSTSWLPLIQYMYDYHPESIGISGCMIVKYTMCTIYTTASTFIMLICVVEVNNSSTNYLYNIIKESKNNIILIAVLFIVFKTIACLVPLVTFHLYESHNQFIANLGKVCSVYIECEAWSTTYLLFDFIYPGLLPTIIFIFTFICCNKNSKSNHKITAEFELTLLNTHSDANNINDLLDGKESANESTCGYKFYPFLFMFTWSLSFFCSFVYGWVNINIFRQNFETMYWIFLIETTCFKWISKKFARQCDKLRSINSDKNYFISLEYMMEWYYSYLYWFGLRDLVLFNTLTIDAFAKTLLIHGMSEMSQSFIRFSNRYYKYSSHIQIKMNEYLCKKNIFEDDSTLDEWRNRMSMDIILRCFASVISGIVVALMLIALGEYGFHETFEQSNDFYTVQFYNIFATSMELVYFIFIILINYKVNNYNIMSMFTIYVMSMSKKHRFFALLPFIGIANIMFVLWYD